MSSTAAKSIVLASLLCTAVGAPSCSKKGKDQAAQKGPAPANGPERATPMDRAATTPLPRQTSTADDLFQRARTAWLQGKCGDAIVLAGAANKIKFAKRNVALMGTCACTLGKRDTALWAYRILQGANRTRLQRLCGAKGIELEDTTAAPAAAPDAAVTAPTPEDKPKEDLSSASGLYSAARRAWLSGQCAKAIRYAQLSNKKKLSTRNLSIIGACACSLRRAGLAKKAFRVLRGGQRNMLLQICRSKGIELN